MKYERKIEENMDCGIVLTMKVIGAKWKTCIIDGINKGHTRPSELHRFIPEATPRVIDIQLSELLEVGVVRKEASKGFPLHTEYCLTDFGMTLLPIVELLENWGNEHMETLKDRLGVLA